MSFKILSILDAKKMCETEGAQVIDIRDQAAFKVSHIKGAQNVNEQNIDQFIASADKDKALIICCYAGMMSQNAASYFAEQGFEEVYSLDGGFAAWSANE
jgi:thiosulfate sulfurtransferase